MRDGEDEKDVIGGKRGRKSDYDGDYDGDGERIGKRKTKIFNH